MKWNLSSYQNYLKTFVSAYNSVKQIITSFYECNIFKQPYNYLKTESAFETYSYSIPLQWMGLKRFLILGYMLWQERNVWQKGKRDRILLESQNIIISKAPQVILTCHYYIITITTIYLVIVDILMPDKPASRDTYQLNT